MKKFFKIIWNIFRIVFVLLIFIYLTFVIVTKISINYNLFGYRVVVISNSNMASVYNINDVLLVSNDYKKLSIGDDITYKGTRGGLNGKIVTSRIIKIDKDDKNDYIYTTKGVSTSFADPSINSNQILGKVMMIIPFISEFNKVSQLPLIFTLIFFIPLFLIILVEIIKTIFEIKDEVIIKQEKRIISYELSKKIKKIKESDYGDIEVLENIEKNIENSNNI